jgi:hypothetical protein
VRIFLSYRRDETSGHSGRLFDALSQRLGRRNVFQDVTGIEPGVDFTEAITRALDASDAVLAVIGPGWSTATTVDGHRRLDEPGDYVRLELAAALTHGTRVIPVLVGGARLPTQEELPADLRELAERQAVVLHDETWSQDVDGLVARLRGEAPTPRRTKRSLIGGAVAAVILIAVLVTWLTWPSADGDGSTAPVPGCRAGGGQAVTLVSPPPGGDVPGNDASGDESTGPFRFDVERAGLRPTGPGSWSVVLQVVMTDGNAVNSASNAPYRYRSLDIDGHPFDVACYTDINPADGEVGPAEKATALVGFDVDRDPHGALQLRLNTEPPVRIALTGP